MVEHPAVNRRVVGSNPTSGANIIRRVGAYNPGCKGWLPNHPLLVFDQLLTILIRIAGEGFNGPLFPEFGGVRIALGCLQTLMA